MKKTLAILLLIASTGALAQTVCAKPLIDATKLSDQEVVDVAAAGGLGKCMAAEYSSTSVSVGLNNASGHTFTQENLNVAMAAGILRDYVAAGVCSQP